MIYFETNKIDYLESDEIENIIRKESIKSAAHLDLSSSVYHTSTEKKFFGHENKKCLIITRIKLPMAKYLPKLIIKFDKQIGFTEYKIKLSVLTTFFVGLLMIICISRIIELIFVKENSSYIFFPIAIIVSLVLLTLREIRLTKNIINNILVNKINFAKE